MELALAKKDEGNAAFSDGRDDDAVRTYLEVLDMLKDKRVVATQEANDLACIVHSNIAAALLKRDLSSASSRALEHCNLALAINPKHVKALFRKSEGLKSLGDFQGSLNALQRALNIEPDNEDIRFALDTIEDIIDEKGPGRAIESSVGREGGADVDEELLESALARVRALREDFAAGRGSATMGEHVILAHGEKVGVININKAFQTQGTLASASGFVRSQHFACSADYALVVVPKRAVKYPLVWWAHDWPFEDLHQDGVFVELHARGTRPITWFMPDVSATSVPKEGRDWELGPATQLCAEAILVESELLPPRIPEPAGADVGTAP